MSRKNADWRPILINIVYIYIILYSHILYILYIHIIIYVCYTLVHFTYGIILTLKISRKSWLQSRKISGEEVVQLSHGLYMSWCFKTVRCWNMAKHGQCPASGDIRVVQSPGEVRTERSLWEGDDVSVSCVNARCQDRHNYDTIIYNSDILWGNMMIPLVSLCMFHIMFTYIYHHFRS